MIRPLLVAASCAVLVACATPPVVTPPAPSPTPAPDPTDGGKPVTPTKGNSATVPGLATAHAGDMVALAKGDYPSLVISAKFPEPGVIIDATGSTIESLSVTGSSHVTLMGAEGPMLSAPPSGVQPKTVYPWSIAKSDHVTLDRVNVHGAANPVLSTQVSGVAISDCADCTVQDSTFTNLHDAIDHVRSPRLTVTVSTFTGLYDDGIRGDVADLTVTGNVYSSGHCDATDVDHPDFVQVWPINYPNGKPVAGGVITVTGNKLVKGGAACGTVHGFFMRMDFKGFGSASAPSVIDVENNDYQGPGDDCVYIHAALPGETAATTVTVKGTTCQAIPCGDKLQDVAGFWIEGADPTKLTIIGNQGAVFQINGKRGAPAGNTILACHN
jgi:hypothetical protein